MPRLVTSNDVKEINAAILHLAQMIKKQNTTASTTTTTSTNAESKQKS